MSSPGRRGGRAGLLILAVIFGMAMAARWISPMPPDLQEDVAGGRFLPPLTRAHLLPVGQHRTWLVTSMRRIEGGWEVTRGGAAATVQDSELSGAPEARFYLLGTDGLGRDMASRLLHGARHSFGIAFICVALASVVGAGVGAASALSGGWPDALMMRGVDAVASVPRLLVFFVCAALTNPSTVLLVLVLSATTWMRLARLVRAEVMAIKHSDLALAALAAGCSRLRLAMRHLLPAAGPVIAVTATLRLADTVLLESAISFLGLGSPTPSVSLGEIMSAGREGLWGATSASWVIVWPGLLIGIVVAALRSATSGLLAAAEPPPV